MKKLLGLSILLLTSLSLFGQSEKIEVEGAMTIGNSDSSTPDAGTIRWTGSDFEGYDGSTWISLTENASGSTSGNNSGSALVIPSETIDPNLNGFTNISVFGNRVALGYPFELSTRGTVHIYELIDEEWQFADFISGSNNGDYFGTDVILWDSLLITGARGADVNGVTDAGVVYVHKYDGTNWQFAESFANEGDGDGMMFGSDLDFDGTTLIVGAPETSVGIFSDVGTAYLYKHINNTWNYVSAIYPSLVTGENVTDLACADVAIDGGLAVCGSSNFGGHMMYFYSDQGVFIDTAQVQGAYSFSDIDVLNSQAIAGNQLLQESSGQWGIEDVLRDPVSFNEFNDVHSVQFISDDEVLVARENDSVPLAEMVHIYEQKSPDEWTITQTLRRLNSISFNLGDIEYSDNVIGICDGDKVYLFRR